MNHEGRRIVESLACERRYGIADAKGAEYSGAGSTYKETGADTLHNFKSVAERTGCTPEQTLMTYLLKHIDSINTAVKEAAACKKDGPHNFYDEEWNPRHVYAKGEGIVSRLDDARNYLDLLECLLVDLGSIAEPDFQAAYDRADGEMNEPFLITDDQGACKDFWQCGPCDEEYWKDYTPVIGVNPPEDGSEPELERLRRLPDTSSDEIIGHDGVTRPRSAPEGTPIIPPLCWGETGEWNNRSGEGWEVPPW